MNLFSVAPYYIYFSITLLLANGIFLLNFERKNFFPIRLGVSICIMFLATYVLFHFDGTVVFDCIIFMLILFLTFFLIQFCLSVKPALAGFVSLAGYSVQFITSQIIYLLSHIVIRIPHPIGNYVFVLIFSFLTLLGYLLFYLFFGKKMNSNIEIQVGKTPLLIFLMLVILVEIILSDIFRIDRHNNSLEVFLLILCAFVVFLLQFSTLNIRTLEDEIEVIKELYSKEIEQYKFSHSMMDMINLKYHDIRHQIRDIGQQAMMSKEVISELEDAVGVYDSLFKTDNVAIDVILAEKSLICQRHHITLSCIVDGKQLNFLKEAEIYSLFGNLLDNAIRAVMDLPVEMRMISLSVKKENDFITICEYNYFKGDISFSDGLPLTSKKDSSNHGYGTRSVLYTAEKYGGTASFYTDHQIFYANIIFLL